MIVIRIARWNSSALSRASRPGQVGEDRGLDGLKQLQRRAHDQHHVEHEPGQPAGQGHAAGLGGDDQHAGVHQRLLGQHDPHHRHREPGPVAQRQIGAGLLHLGVGGTLAGGVGDRHLGRRRARAAARRRTASRTARRTAPPPCPDRRRPGPSRCPPPPPGRTGSATSTPGTPARRTGEALVAGQPAAGEVAGGVGQHADDQDPVQRARAVEHPVLDLRAQRQRDDQEDEREADLDDRRERAAGGRAARARGGRRSCARAAARSAGRSPTGSRT